MTTSGYRAATEGAAWRPLDDRRLLLASGADAVSFLDRILSNELSRLAPGEGCRSLLLDNRGRLQAEVLTHRVVGGLLLETDSSRSTVLAETLERLRFSEEVAFESLEGRLAGAAVFGPASAELLARVGYPALPAMPHGCSEGGGGWSMRWDELGSPGYRIWFPSARSADFAKALEAAGAVRLGDEELEVLRVEQGRPRWGADADETTIAFEAGYRDAVSVRKCYPGQEVLSRIHHLGHVNRQLAGIAMDSPLPPRPGESVQAGGEIVGTVTSAIVSPILGKPLALAMLKRGFAGAGTALDVGGAPGRVVELPLTPLNKRHPPESQP